MLLPLESTLALPDPLDVALSEDVLFTLANEVLTLIGASADVAEAGPATPAADDACNSDPAEDVAEPAPAPEDDPPVADGVTATVPFVDACT
jgi:hypothetical protein